jgi:DNA-binding FadR family transcriptional regulator
MPFKKIESRSKSAYAAEQLISAIKDGTYKKGDRLPSARVLAEEMGVSRPLIREALAALQITGIIESRAGDGTYIRRAIGDSNLEEHVLSILEEDKDPMEVLEARRVLEEGTVKLAVERVGPEDLEKMKRILALEKEATADRNYEGYVKADRNFHLAIVTAAHNSLLAAAVLPLIGVMGQRVWGGIDQLYVFNTQGIAQTLKEHKRILEAIRKKDAQEAEGAMRCHLKNARDRFLGDQQKGFPEVKGG